MLRSCWFGAIPALLAGLYLRDAMPSPLSANVGSTGRWLAALALDAPLATAVLLFLGFSALLHYWRLRLPGGRYLAHLPPELCAAVERDELEALESLWALQRELSRPELLRRLSLRLGAARSEHVAEQAEALARATSQADLRSAGQLGAELRDSVSVELRELRRARLVRLVLAVAVAAGAGAWARGHIWQSCRIQGASMLPSLESGELVVTNRLAYRPLLSSHELRWPARGEIVVLEGAPGSTEAIVKRVVGLPGDHIHFESGFPMINGWLVPHCDAGRYSAPLPEADFDGRLLVEFLGDSVYLTVYSPVGRAADDYDVPPGEVFVLGDNRNDSLDSRRWDHGKPAGVALAAIEGRVTRLLARLRPDHTLDFRPFGRAPGLVLERPGVDFHELAAGVDRCVRARPRQTLPPQRSGS